MTKSTLLKIIKLTLLILGIVLLLILVVKSDLKEIKKVFVEAKVIFLISGLSVYLLLTLTRALKWYLLIRTAEIKLKYRNFLPFYFINFLMGNITPFKSGEALTPFLFNKYFKLPAGQGFSIVILDRFFELIIFTIILFLSTFYVIDSNIENNLIISIFQGIFIGLFIIIILLIIVIFSRKTTQKIFSLFNSFKRFLLLKKILNFIEKEINLFYEGLKIFKNKKVFRFMIPLTIICWFLEFFSFYVIFRSVMSVSFLKIAVAQTISMAATFISFVPGGIGVGEFGTVYILNSFGYSTILSTAGALLARLILTGTLMVLGILSVLFLKEKK